MLEDGTMVDGTLANGTMADSTIGDGTVAVAVDNQCLCEVLAA